jgi:alanine racemase
VVKGNGYGFGRARLVSEAHQLGVQVVAFGTVHEVGILPETMPPLVLTPEMGPLPDTLPPTALLTVGSVAHVEHLARVGWEGRVVLKLRSTMLRYGVPPDELPHLAAAAHAAHLEPVAYALHLPLAGSDEDRLTEVQRWLPHLDHELTVHVSHLGAGAYRTLIDAHPGRSFAIRVGTSLWHGDKSMLHLSATVNDVHPVRAGQPAGYRLTPAPVNGHLVLVGAGSAHGVAPLPDGRSPFHFARHRLELLEPSHMHTSMVVVPDGQPCPAPGDEVDVQRPLTQTLVDTIVWLP